MDDITLDEISQAITSLESPAQFAKTFDLELSEDQLDLIFQHLLNDPEKNLWALRGLAANHRISLGCLEQCIYSLFDTHLFAIQNPRVDELTGSKELPIHQIESVRNALGQRALYQSLIDESSSADTSQERFAELAAMNLTSGAYIGFWHDQEAAEGRRDDLFYGSDANGVTLSDDAEAVLEEFIDLDTSPEFPELLWRVQANRKSENFLSAQISYLGECFEFDILSHLLVLLPARLAFVIAGEAENYDESWPMLQMEYSTFDINIENALKMAHPSTSDVDRNAKINDLIGSAYYDPSQLDMESNWITLLSAILYTQDTDLLESIAQGDNDLWKLAVILNPASSANVLDLADDFEGDFSIEALIEVDFFEEMVEYATETGDLDAAQHWKKLLGDSDEDDSEDEDNFDNDNFDDDDE